MATAVAAAMFLAGCAGGTSSAPRSPSAPATAATKASSSPSPSAQALNASCGQSTAGGQTVRFGSGGATNLVGVLLGTGRTGVVLAHQYRGTRCQWGDYPQELANSGYRVLAFDFAGSGLSTGTDDNDAAVLSAAAYLRTQGVEKVVLIGASMGGTAVVAAATKITPPVAGVVSLSGPARFRGVDAAEAAKKLAVPVLYAVCAGDSDFVPDAQTLYDGTAAGAAKKLLVVPNCDSHGVQLTDKAGGPEATAVRAALQNFLATNAAA